jgi:gliding motility-associated-like protein
MKQITIILSSLALLITGTMSAFAGEGNTSWQLKMENPKSFIENKGQFRIAGDKPMEPSAVKYAWDNGSTMIYFTNTGVTYSFLKRWKEETDAKEEARERSHEERELMKGRSHADIEKDEHKMKFKTDVVNMTWENANPNAQLIASEPTSDYFTYPDESRQNNKNFEKVKAYKKLTYKNLYPNIDVEYVFHPESGIKYSLILHPGADLSVVKMKYDNGADLKANGELHIRTEFGDMVEHAPVSFYNGESSNFVASRFTKQGKSFSFSLGNYDASRTLVIDPWVQTPTLNNTNGVWECEKDASGNVYIIGGDMPMKLQKYSSAGVLQWTYNTPWDTANYWLGTLATDQAGFSYITAGSAAKIQKISAAGALVWNASGGALDEFWTIAFNCDQTKLVVGGTRLGPFPPAGSNGIIFEINTGTGATTSVKKVGWTRTTTVFGFPITDIEEVRSISSSYNSRYYYLTLDSIGAVDQNFSSCPTSTTLFGINDGYSFAYKSEDYRPNNGNGGMCAIRANKNFVYTQNGTTIQKRNPTTGAIITSAAIPGGISVASGSLNQAGNSGIDLDSCGNVYVGSGNAVIKYSSNLVLLSSTALPFRVSDVSVSYGGDVIVCGTTGTSSTTTRTGYVQSLNMSACYPQLLACCNTTVCPVAPVCVSASPFNLTAAAPGGTWSGTGITNAALGTFSPAVSGAGTFTISYITSCGTGTVSITVNPCTALSVCAESTGQLTVSGGSGPYSWQQQVTTTPCVPGVGFCSGFGTVAGPPVTSWSTFTTGTTITPPGTYPLQVVDNSGTTFLISSFGALPACSSSCPTLTVNITSQVNVTCFGASTGSFNASTTGGATPWDYTLMNGSTTVATFTNVPGTQSFTGLPAGTYTLNVLDNNGCPGTATITITQPSGPTTTANAGSNQTICGTTATLAGNTATIGTGTWTLTSGTGTITTPSSPTSGITGLGVGANVFTWTISNPPCGSTTSSVTITGVAAPTTSNAGTPQTVCGTTATLAGNTPTAGTGTWTLTSGSGTITTPSSPTSGVTGLGVGANVFTWTISNPPCTPSASTVTITGVAAPTTANAGPTQSGCTTSVTMAGNTPTVGTGTWTLVSGSGTITTPSSPTTTITGIGAGTSVFMWTISNPPCTPSTDTVSIINTGGPTASNAGPAQTVCGSTATLAGNTPTVGTGTWTLTSGAGSVTTPSSATSGVTGLGVGPNVFTWTISNPPCTPSTSTVTITGVAAPTTANAGPTQSGCASSVTMAGNTPTVGTGTWTLVSGSGTITTPSSPTTTVTGIGTGTSIFMWTISNPPCSPSTDTVSIINTGGPTASNAGPAQTVCGSTATLAGNTPTVGTGTWTLTSGAGTITTPSSPTSGVTGLGVGPNVFTWTISNPPCTPSTSTVTITGVAAPTTSNAGPNQSLCSSSATLAGNMPTVGTGAWTLVSGTGTITTPSSPTSTVTGLGVGPNVFMWTISNAPCPSSTSTVTITNTGGPSLSITSQTNVFCNGNSTGSATVSGSGGTGSLTYSWSGGAGSGTTATGLPAGTYTVTVTDGAGCSSTAFVNITQPAALTASVSTTATNCGTSTGSANVSVGGGTGSYTYNWTPGNPTGDGTASITNISAGTYTVTITDSLGCTQSASGAVGSVGGPPVNAGADVTIVSGGSAVLNGSSTSGATYSWSPAGSLSCDTCASTIASPVETTTYTLTVNAGGCIGYDTVTVFVEVECGELFVPNVFSPNGDGANDVLKVYGNCITELDFAIYDRWGERVFETTDPAITWDGRYQGKLLDAAVFVYYLQAKVKGEEVRKHGNITLVK